jgi:hypothetical protein
LIIGVVIREAGGSLMQCAARFRYYDDDRDRMNLRPLLCWIFALFSATGAAIPKFEDYRTQDVLTGPAVVPVVSRPNQRTFKTRIVEEARLGVNFAGLYRIAEWGCGSSCVSIAVVNLQTGAVYYGPFKLLGYGTRRRYEGGEDELEYRGDSRLMVARGCPGDRDCGTYYFEWKGERFLRLRYVPAGPATP